MSPSFRFVAMLAGRDGALLDSAFAQLGRYRRLNHVRSRELDGLLAMKEVAGRRSQVAVRVASGKLVLASPYYFRLSAISVERLSAPLDYGKYAYIERLIDDRRKK